MVWLGPGEQPDYGVVHAPVRRSEMDETGWRRTSVVVSEETLAEMSRAQLVDLHEGLLAATVMVGRALSGLGPDPSGNDAVVTPSSP